MTRGDAPARSRGSWADLAAEVFVGCALMGGSGGVRPTSYSRRLALFGPRSGQTDRIAAMASARTVAASAEKRRSVGPRPGWRTIGDHFDSTGRGVAGSPSKRIVSFGNVAAAYGKLVGEKEGR